jgi:hypothetical protein
MSTGYACPVCDDPQADAGHLANHLAFTAMLRDDGHGAWLDEHVPDWSDRGEADLAAELRERADDLLEEREYPQVFEDTTGEDGHAPGRDDPGERSGALFDDAGGHDHAHDHAGHQHGHGGSPAADLPAGAEMGSVPGGEVPDEEREAIMEEAREMTRQLREEGDGAEAGADTVGEDDEADAGDAGADAGNE